MTTSNWRGNGESSTSILAPLGRPRRKGEVSPTRPFGALLAALLRDDTLQWSGGACFSLPSNHWRTYEKRVYRRERGFGRTGGHTGRLALVKRHQGKATRACPTTASK